VVISEDGGATFKIAKSGLPDYRPTANTMWGMSYPRGLAALVDGRSNRYAVIDVGTNSIKFHVAEQAPGGPRRPYRTNSL
jgi:exopolyphosphatase/guanosine-5'-triphosphate,3'-diphosphate pyrophosphatase